MKNSLPVIKFFLGGIIISSFIFSPFLLDLTLVPRFICLTLCLILAVYTLYRNGSKTKVGIDLILLAYLAYCLFCCLSYFWSKNKAESLFETSKIILSLLVFLFTYFSLKQDKNYFIEKLFKSSIVLFLIVFFFGCYQYFGITHLNEETLYSVNGLNGHKNLFSSFLFLNLFFLITAFHKLTKGWKKAAGICLILNLVFIFLLKTKAVWLGLIIFVFAFGIIYLWQLNSKKIKINHYAFLVIFILATNVFFFFGLESFINKGIQSDSPSTHLATDKPKILTSEQERLVLWNKTYYMIKAHPFAGVGMGNWQIYFPDASLSGLWRAEDLNYTFQRPHNDFLWILSETGIIGFNLFLFFLFSSIIFLLKTINNVLEDRSLQFHLTLCFSFILGYFSISFFDFPKERIEHIIWVNVMLGIVYFYIKEHLSLPNYINFSLTRIKFVLPMIVLIFVVCIGILRYKGEYYMKRLLFYKNHNENYNLIGEGRAAFSFAYSIDPTSIPIHWYTGNANAVIQNYEGAHKDFLMAYKFNPYNRNVLNDLASSYFFMANLDSAKKYYRESARISPRFDDPKLNMAAIYIRERKFDSASIWLNSLYHDSERRTNYQNIIKAQH